MRDNDVISARTVERSNRYGELMGRRVFLELNGIKVGYYDPQGGMGNKHTLLGVVAYIPEDYRRRCATAEFGKDESSLLSNATLAFFKELCVEVQNGLDFGLKTLEEYRDEARKHPGGRAF